MKSFKIKENKHLYLEAVSKILLPHTKKCILQKHSILLNRRMEHE